MSPKDPRFFHPIDQSLPPGTRNLIAPRCEAPGCNKGTKEGKRFCVLHVLCNPYAAAVAALVAPEPEGFAYTLTCQDCDSPFRAKSKKAKMCPQCKRAEVNKRSAKKREEKKAS